MSNSYYLEPPTKGKVILTTSCGEIEIELWPKEAPKACRNFVQLCIEKYYDNVIFHRVIKDFIVQGGDKSGTGQQGETIYGEKFQDEFHSRLKFHHRGIVACAGTNSKNDSQFFITLDKTESLNYKHTIFGKVVGQTIFNVLKMNELEIIDDKPKYPPKIIKTEVIWNPFDDIVPRFVSPKLEKKKEIKGTKDKTLLSFEEEEIKDENTIKMKILHDLVEDKKLSAQPAVELKKIDVKVDQKKDDLKSRIKNVLDKKKEEKKEVTNNETNQEQVQSNDSKVKIEKKEEKETNFARNYLLEQKKKYSNKKRKKDEDEVLKKLEFFSKKLKKQEEPWMKTTLKFEKEKTENADSYQVLDPKEEEHEDLEEN